MFNRHARCLLYIKESLKYGKEPLLSSRSPTEELLAELRGHERGWAHLNFERCIAHEIRSENLPVNLQDLIVTDQYLYFGYIIPSNIVDKDVFRICRGELSTGKLDLEWTDVVIPGFPWPDTRTMRMVLDDTQDLLLIERVTRSTGR
jgi:hypothetical protein